MDNGESSYRRFLAGDDDGFVEIVRDYKDGLTFYLNGYVRDIHIAEELTEDTFFKLLVKKPRYTHKCTFKTWLYTIGRNTALDYLRHNAKKCDIDLDIILKDEENLEREYLKEERKITVHKALRKINPEYSRVLYLSYFEDFDNAETARIMKKSKRQVENLLYRAKQSLKAELNKEGFIYEEL